MAAAWGLVSLGQDRSLCQRDRIKSSTPEITKNISFMFKISLKTPVDATMLVPKPFNTKPQLANL